MGWAKFHPRPVACPSHCCFLEFFFQLHPRILGLFSLTAPLHLRGTPLLIFILFLLFSILYSTRGHDPVSYACICRKTDCLYDEGGKEIKGFHPKKLTIFLGGAQLVGHVSAAVSTKRPTPRVLRPPVRLGQNELLFFTMVGITCVLLALI